MRTFKEYQEKLNSMRKNVYINGELVERNDPRLLGGQNIMGITFDAAMSDDPELRELATQPLILPVTRLTALPISIRRQTIC